MSQRIMQIIKLTMSRIQQSNNAAQIEFNARVNNKKGWVEDIV